MHTTTAHARRSKPERLLSAQVAGSRLLEAASLIGYGSGGRTGLLPVLAGGQPAYREAEVHALAGLIRAQLGAA